MQNKPGERGKKPDDDEFTCAQELQPLTAMPILHYNNDFLMLTIRHDAVWLE